MARKPVEDTASDAAPRTVTSVGGLVRRGDTLLVGRLTYSPTQGQYMLPGGVVEPGETLDVAIAREVLEETGVVARPAGIVAVNSIVYLGDTHTYVVWLLDALDGVPTADGVELDDCRFMTYAELATRHDINYVARYFAAKLLNGDLHVLQRADDYAEYVEGLGPETYRVFR